MSQEINTEPEERTSEDKNGWNSIGILRYSPPQTARHSPDIFLPEAQMDKNGWNCIDIIRYFPGYSPPQRARYSPDIFLSVAQMDKNAGIV